MSILTINLNAPASRLTDLIITDHTHGGVWEWDSGQVTTCLAPGQSCTTIDSDEMLRAMGWKRVMNANLLDWLLRNRHRIPAGWGDCCLFWGTRFRTARHRRCVRTLERSRGGWASGLHWFDVGFDQSHPVVVWR